MSLTIKLNEATFYNDSLSFVLTGFSHKRPYTGGPTAATAYVTVIHDGNQEDIQLSIHGTQGCPTIEQYDSVVWKGYEFQLEKFDYDTSIRISVSESVRHQSKMTGEPYAPESE